MTKHIFLFSLAILAGSLIWILKVKEDIDGQINRKPEQIFAGQLPHHFEILKTIHTDQADLGEIYEKNNKISLSLIWPTQSPSGISPNSLLSSAKDYRINKTLSENVPAFVTKYLSAHVDARRITPLREFTIEESQITAVTFRLKDDRYYALAVDSATNGFLFASREKGPITEQQLTDIVEQIPRLKYSGRK